MNIQGKKVSLRAISHADLPMICELFNDPNIEDSVVGWAFPISIEQQEQWYNSHLTDTKNLRFVVETIDDGAIGIATLTDIDWKNKNATHGIKLLNKPRHTSGVGIDTVMAIMRYAFDELGLHRLNGAWFNSNEPSKKLYTHCGWKVEGVQRESVYKHGNFRDLTMVGILESDYRTLIKKNHYWEDE